MARAIALMFHGIEGAASRRVGYAADPHYTVARPTFEAMLAAIGAGGTVVGAAHALIDVDDGRDQAWLTFDDGDASNLLDALPALLDAGLKADFFVNPARVGRPGFVDWAGLRAMATAGMGIQSHGHTHTYFSQLDPAALHEELRISKMEIEQRIGQPVRLLAPPGGRVVRGLAGLARSLGYRAVLDSTPGLITGRRGDDPLPRVAVTAATTPAQVAGWFRPGSPGLARLRWRHRMLATAKQALGDDRYERLRARLLGVAA